MLDLREVWRLKNYTTNKQVKKKVVYQSSFILPNMFLPWVLQLLFSRTLKHESVSFFLLLLRQAEVSPSFVNLSVMSYLLHFPKLYRYLFFCFILHFVYSVDFVILKVFIIMFFFIFMFFIIMWLLERS